MVEELKPNLPLHSRADIQRHAENIAARAGESL